MSGEWQCNGCDREQDELNDCGAWFCGGCMDDFFAFRNGEMAIVARIVGIVRRHQKRTDNLTLYGQDKLPKTNPS